MFPKIKDYAQHVHLLRCSVEVSISTIINYAPLLEEALEDGDSELAYKVEAMLQYYRYRIYKLEKRTDKCSLAFIALYERFCPEARIFDDEVESYGFSVVDTLEFEDDDEYLKKFQALELSSAESSNVDHVNSSLETASPVNEFTDVGPLNNEDEDIQCIPSSLTCSCAPSEPPQQSVAPTSPVLDPVFEQIVDALPLVLTDQTFEQLISDAKSVRAELKRENTLVRSDGRILCAWKYAIVRHCYLLRHRDIRVSALLDRRAFEGVDFIAIRRTKIRGARVRSLVELARLADIRSYCRDVTCGKF